MKRKNFLMLLNAILFPTILIAIPYLAGDWKVLIFSWVPAAFIFGLFEDMINKMK